MKDAASFWDKVARKYAKQPIADEAAYRLTLEKTISHIRPDMRILELGAGTGSTALLLAEHAKHVVATDVSGEMTRIGQEKAVAGQVANIEFLQADVYDNFLKGDKWDMIAAHNLLHLLPDIPVAIDRIAARLEPGGLFVSKTVCAFGPGTPLKWRALKWLLPVMQFLGKAPHVSFLTESEWLDAIRAGGFEILESGKFPAGALSQYVVARKS